MPHVCPQCSRTNPDEALYCYFDGKALGQDARGQGPVNVARQIFAVSFSLTPGVACRNFEELSLALVEHPTEAIEALKSGALARFLGNIGRADLAQAARQAGQSPDLERGLDDLLSRLPGDTLQVPRLVVEPAAVELGQLKVGDDRSFSLHLKNSGQRFIVGSVDCSSCDWLFLGDAPGVRQKLIRFQREMTLPVQVRGKTLRASPRPLEGRIVIQTNGGQVAVRVRATVPIQAFPDGPLAGCVSLRQVAERASTHPREIIPLLTSGAIARWYQQNGWRYPISGPTAAGLAAVQQYLEALGVTPPPRVEISDREVVLQASAGSRVDYELRVFSAQKRPVYASASCKDSWLRIGGTRLKGNQAIVPLSVPSVPGRDGDTWKSSINVSANGNQRFRVAVTLVVAAGADGGQAAGRAAPAGDWLDRLSRAPADAFASIRRALYPTAADTHAPRTPTWLHALLPVFLALALLLTILHDAVLRPSRPAPPPPPRVEAVRGSGPRFTRASPPSGRPGSGTGSCGQRWPGRSRPCREG